MKPPRNLLHFLLDQLSELDSIQVRKEIGQLGFYVGDHMFGLISGGHFWLRTPGPNTCPMTGKKRTERVQALAQRGQYYSRVPESVLGNRPALTQWANWSMNPSISTPPQ